MATNVNNSLKTRRVGLASAVANGDLVAVGGLVGIAENASVVGKDGKNWVTLALDGVAHKACSTAVNVGDNLYYTDKDTVTKTTGTKFVGVAVTYKASGGTGSAGQIWFEITQAAT